MSIMHNDIVEEFPLRKLAKDDSFEQTCRAFVQAMKVGICVMDDQGNVVSDVRRDNEHHCQLFNQTHEGRRHCSEVLDQVRCSKFDSHEEWREISCLSGLVYWVSPIVFGGESLGISILGPLKPWPKRPSAPRRLEILGEEFDLQTGDAASLMIQITQPADEALKVWSGFLDSFLNLYFRLHLTSQLHLATMDAAYSDLKLRNEALENSNAKLSELDQSKSNFIATISHELKTPLTSIIGYAEMLSEGLVGPIRDEQKRPLNTILEKGEHLLELIEQLLDLAKSDVRDSRFESTEIIIKTWLDRSLSDVRPQAERKKLILIREEDPAVPVWHGDFRRLRRVLTNLLSNAVKFTPEGGTSQ